ncbi:hypothetical protein FYJ91_07700 [Sphingomonas montanisoli]|uniref:Uncharacterized protein n=1 Tax=Sphingomonas montanisoli TaxID=2606412 RepID=A0A5D9C9V6_9SPHN|nr:hypothetical protein FYJ91_07700 [Sphingomonas montanisoli]
MFRPAVATPCAPHATARAPVAAAAADRASQATICRSATGAGRRAGAPRAPSRCRDAPRGTSHRRRRRPSARHRHFPPAA